MYACDLFAFIGKFLVMLWISRIRVISSELRPYLRDSPDETCLRHGNKETKTIRIGWTHHVLDLVARVLISSEFELSKWISKLVAVFAQASRYWMSVRHTNKKLVLPLTWRIFTTHKNIYTREIVAVWLCAQKTGVQGGCVTLKTDLACSEE